MQPAGLLARSFRAESGSDDHEFIAAHAGDIIVAAVDFPQSRAEILQQVVAFEVAIEIVNLLEVVEVAHHHGKRGSGPAAARQFARKMDEQ